MDVIDDDAALEAAARLTFAHLIIVDAQAAPWAYDGHGQIEVRNQRQLAEARRVVAGETPQT